MFKNAIVRKPCPEMVNGLTSANLGKPDFQLAQIQHNNYIEALKSCGLQVKIMDSNNNFPDSTFIEDVAICTPHCAVITNPGALSRRNEKNAMRPIMEEYYKNIHEIIFTGTLDGGDVMMVGSHFYIGISERTNQEGAQQLITILKKYDLTGSVIPLSTMLHLKTGMSYIENNNLLICGEFIENPEFKKFNRIIIDPDETYAANSLWINNKVIVPKGFPKTKSKIEHAGYETIDVDVSEFRKLDGGLSCLSLRF